MGTIPQIGVGIQYNPEILSWFPFEEQPVDAFEVLLDSVMGALDSPYPVLPAVFEHVRALRAKAPIIAHSNYGGEFGFGPLEASAAVRRHVPMSRSLESPWVADHCFYGDNSWSDMWSSPLQFSHAEIARLAPRARRLQELYGVPLLHENAAYYVPCPGGEMLEAEFLARLVEAAGTYLLLDLHNIYTNSINHPSYRTADFLATIPLDRVVEIHIAGGSYSCGFYHDWHDSHVPEPVWEMLEFVLRSAHISAVILEFQGRSHHEDTRVLGREGDVAMIRSDIKRAGDLWDRVYGPGSRRGSSHGC